MTWTNFWRDAPERLEEVKRGWRNNETASEIANAIGNGCTRSMVLSAVQRLRAAGEEMPARPARGNGMQRIKKNPGPGGFRLPTVASTKAEQLLNRIEMERSKKVRSSPMVFPKVGGCRYPIGDVLDDDFKWCDEPRIDDSSYCACHHQLCHVNWNPLKAAWRKKKSRSEPLRTMRRHERLPQYSRGY
jgi:hypothetical protein